MKVSYIITTLLLTLLISCSQKSHLIQLADSKYQIDKRLIGLWAGSEADNQIDGMVKEWKMLRNLDGTFVLDFKATLSGESQSFVEKGKWWIENGSFHEYHKDSGKTDTYSYEVLDPDRVKFIAESIGIEHVNQDYQFIDTRIYK